MDINWGLAICNFSNQLLQHWCTLDIAIILKAWDHKTWVRINQSTVPSNSHFRVKFVGSYLVSENRACAANVLFYK